MRTREVEKAFTSMLDDIQQKMDETNSNINVITTPSKMPIMNQFVLMFFAAFLSLIDEFKLTRNDIRVILKILEIMQFGNLVRVSWTRLGKSIGITPTNMGRHVKTLKDSKLLIEDEDGNIYLNPQVIAKGKFLSSRQNADIDRLLDLGADALKGTSATPSILTPKMRKEMKEEAIQEKKLEQLREDMGLKSVRKGKKQR